MIKLLLPILLAMGWAYAMYRMSIGRLSADLDQNSRPIDDPELEALVRRMGAFSSPQGFLSATSAVR